MAQDTKKPRPGVRTARGRVTVDSRGNNVWQWDGDDATGDTSVLLRSLDNDALAIESTVRVPIPAEVPPQATGGESGESTSVMLQRLDNSELAIEPTWVAPIPSGLAERAGGSRQSPRRRQREEPDDDDDDSAGGGFNPYDRS